MDPKFNIAILLPTRGRTDALKRSVDSLIEHADDISQVQLMFGLDRDDDVGINYFNDILKPILDQSNIAYTAVKFNPLGYININRYGNVLEEYASANLYMFCNDDAIMHTKGWDTIIKSYNEQFKLLAVRTHKDHPYSIFPIVPAVWMKLLGHLSPHQMIDAWLSQLAYMLNIMERIEVYVEHDRHDLTGGNHDETFKKRMCLEGKPHDPVDFHHIDQTLARMTECEKLASYMKTLNMDTTFWENVKTGKQDPWEKLKEYDINNQMMQFSMSVDKQTNQVSYTK
jgi:hypothetical protein